MLGSQADGCLLRLHARELASSLLLRGGRFLSFLRGEVVLHRGVRVQDVYFDLVYLVVFLQCMPPQVLHLNVDVEQLNAFADVLLHLDHEELVYLHELLQVLSIPAHALGALGLTLNFPLDGLFVFVVLLLNMVEEVLEQLAVVQFRLSSSGWSAFQAWTPSRSSPLTRKLGVPSMPYSRMSRMLVSASAVAFVSSVRQRSSWVRS